MFLSYRLLMLLQRLEASVGDEASSAVQSPSSAGPPLSDSTSESTDDDVVMQDKPTPRVTAGTRMFSFLIALCC